MKNILFFNLCSLLILFIISCSNSKNANITGKKLLLRAALNNNVLLDMDFLKSPIETKCISIIIDTITVKKGAIKNDFFKFKNYSYPSHLIYDVELYNELKKSKIISFSIVSPLYVTTSESVIEGNCINDIANEKVNKILSKYKERKLKGDIKTSNLYFSDIKLKNEKGDVIIANDILLKLSDEDGNK